MPKRGSVGAAGLDLFVPTDKPEWWLNPGYAESLPLGFAAAFDSGWVALIHDRSGMGLKGAMKRCGVIDCDYRGEWILRLWNGGDDPILITPSKAVAQVIFMPCWMGNVLEVNDLDSTERGEGRYGSTDATASLKEANERLSV